MNQIAHGLREAGLTLAYHAFLNLREGFHWLSQPISLGVRAVVQQDDRILLVRHRSGATPWSLPGGGVDRGEDLPSAARREIREEGGCDVVVNHLLGVYYHNTHGLSDHIAVFVCTALAPALPPVGDIEIVDARFFLPQDIPTNTDAGSLHRIAEFHQGLIALSRLW